MLIFLHLVLTAHFQRHSSMQDWIQKRGYSGKITPEDWQYYDTAHVVHRFVDMTLEDFIDGMQYVYDHIYAGDNLRTRFRNSIKTTKNPRNSMFAFRVGSDWKQVLNKYCRIWKELYDSGDYYQDWYKSSAVTVSKPVMETVTT